MEKLKKYNQTLLAIIGISLILFILGAGIFAIFDNYDRHHRTPDVGEEGVRIAEQTDNEDVSRDTLRYQEITYLDPVQLDSGIAKFIIPVSQVNLDAPENIRGQNEMGLSKLANLYASKDLQYRNYYGYFNNFIVLDNAKHTQYPVFSTRVSIT